MNSYGDGNTYRGTANNLTSIIIYLHDIELEVYYTAHKAIKGTKGSCGEPLEPDEESGIEISGVYIVNRSDDIFDLFSTDICELEEKVLEALSYEE